MTLILEDVISEAKKKYKLNVREDNKPKYLEFLQKQIELHGYDLDKTNDGKNKKLIHRDLLVDEMYLYACLIREQPVMWIEFGGRIRLKEDKDLNLLRSRGNVTYLWPDQNLFHIHQGRKRDNKEYGVPTYCEILGELGKLPEVVSIWSRELEYKTDIGIKVRKPERGNYKVDDPSF